MNAAPEFKPQATRHLPASAPCSARAQPSLRCIILTLLATLAALQGPVAQAQAVPDAGALQQQIDRERLPRLPAAAPERAAAPEPMRSSGGAAVTVREFRFAGNTRLSAAELAPAVGPYLDRPVDFGQLQAAAAGVAQLYREAGWVVRTYLPAQDVKNGVITIQVVEAVFGRVVVEGPAPGRMAPAQVVAGFAALLRPGDPLNTQTLDRALLVADDLPGVVVAGSLQEG
ncbi:MAG: POTRA domain-containing protein, partial [Hydrogenophaga sp.]|nr:POTRA domain-containing protein [Hydrogenophaga sp.]